MAFDPNPLYYRMLQIFSENYSPDNRVEIYNEGSSRSSKTWDTFHFIYTYCDHNRGKSKDIYILRNILKDCREYTYKEFKKCMNVIGVADPDIVYTKENQEPTVYLFGNNIYFRGLNDELNQEGYPSDITFVNEMLEVPQRSKIAGILMRCVVMFIGDWNPKFTQHWAFELESRDNATFTRTNYRQNKHCPKSVVKEIESYYPWLIEDMHLPEKERRPNLTNIKNGTADAFRAMVYGEGIRSAQSGLIFPHVAYIEEWPQDVAITRGMDFGFTSDPTALVNFGQKDKNVYLELLLYEPTETPTLIDDYADSKELNKRIVCTADSSDKYTGENKGTVEMVSSLRKKGWQISKVSKTKSIMFWLTQMKEYKIHIVINDLSHHAKKEQENYTMKKVNGIEVNQPIDNFNHFWDASRYAFMSFNNGKNIPFLGGF